MMLLADDSSLFGDQPDPSETPWTPQRDLLGSERFAREFVVETENDGSAWLRFGDNQFGAAPITGQRLLARYRLGGGPRGNVGAEAISALVSDDASLMLGIQSLRNPLPAQGGADPETPRRHPPQRPGSLPHAGTRRHHRRLRPRRRAPPRRATRGSPPALDGQLVHRLPDARPPRRQAGRCRIQGDHARLPRTFPAGWLRLRIRRPGACPARYPAADLRRQRLFRRRRQSRAARSLHRHVDRHGRPGFFHPDGFTFGTPLYLSAVVARAMAVAGVASVDIRRFQRWGRSAKGELAAGVITASHARSPACRWRPQFP
jgi:hypothetical protein